MPLNEAFIWELKRESALTKRVFERIPDEKFGWKPHEKSMSFSQLANHISQLPLWMATAITTDEMNLADTGEQPKPAETQAELLQNTDVYIEKALAALENASDENLLANWKLKHGDHVIMDMPRAQFLRTAMVNHIIHHRGQLTVYLRMNDIPVPGLYGPSADEK